MRTRMNPEERKALILATAEEAFATDSYQNVSVAHVAKAAGVSVALVHKYFESKSGLFAAVLAEKFRNLRLLQNEYSREATGARDQMAATIEAHLDFVAKLRRPHEVQHFLYGHDDARASDVRRLDERAFLAKLRTIIQPNPNSRDTYALLTFHGLLQAGTRAWAQRGCPPDEKFPVIEVILGGLEGMLGDWRR